MQCKRQIQKLRYYINKFNKEKKLGSNQESKEAKWPTTSDLKTILVTDRELNLLSNKDFIITIFLKISLAKVEKDKDLFKYLALSLLRFLVYYRSILLYN